MTLTSAVNAVVVECTTAVHELLTWTRSVAAFQGDAWSWGPRAAAAGYHVTGSEVGTAPAAAPGDVVVWNRGQAGASSAFGHVADVTQVNPDGSLVVENANWPIGSGIHAMAVSAATARQLTYIAPLGGAPASSADLVGAAAAAAAGVGQGLQSAAPSGAAAVGTSFANWLTGTGKWAAGNVEGNLVPLIFAFIVVYLVLAPRLSAGGGGPVGV